MAVKKSATPKTSSAPKSTSTKKAAPKKAAPKKATTKKSPPKKSTMPAQAKAKPAAKKAPAIKLSDSQTRVLGSVNQAGETGYAAGKGEGKILESLLNKKLVKRGKKVEGVARFLMTKAGSKHAATPAAPVAPSADRPRAGSGVGTRASARGLKPSPQCARRPGIRARDPGATDFGPRQVARHIESSPRSNGDLDTSPLPSRGHVVSGTRYGPGPPVDPLASHPGAGLGGCAAGR